MDEVAAHGLALIDLVVVDLYPFEDKVLGGTLPSADAMEYIDIGGPTLLRAAAKNWADVTVVCDPRQYPDFLAELQQHQGSTSDALRQRLALEAFQRTAAYDAAISTYLQRVHADNDTIAAFAAYETPALHRVHTLRYGENPHQSAALYGSVPAVYPSLVTAQQLHGKEVSFNNLADADAALTAVQAFQEPAVVIMKHQTPCGIAVGATLAEAYEHAYATDPDAASGGVISCNCEVDAAMAHAIGDRFLEVILAPSFHPQALERLTQRRNRVILAWGTAPASQDSAWAPRQWRSIAGGALVQDADRSQISAADVRVVTERHPTAAEMTALLFAWQVVKYVKSNAIVLVRDQQTIGIGAGQMSRVDASRVALMKARSSTHGCVAASDAFFPFSDGLEVIAEAGVQAVIQPGGSVRDKDVIAAVNAHHMAMVFTGKRAFRH
jgi:phosphoribosylaminoimidazolecarboxamide formyltransferase/IMP cyclohydrolase